MVSGLYKTFHELVATGGEIGQRRPRIDGLQNVTGSRKFVDDLYLPNMLVSKGVYSKYPHAKLIKVDTGEAKKLPGVRAVITAKDFPHNKYKELIPDHPCLAEGKVRYIGEWIAVVAAEREDIAEEACQLIEVQYEELPPVFDPREAMKPGAPIIHEEYPDNIVPFAENINRCQIRNGDVDKGFKEADYIFKHTFSTQVQEHAYLEPHSALAQVDDTGKLTIWSITQMPFFHATDVCKALKIPLSKVRVIAVQAGGSFGGKNNPSLEPHVGLLALKTRRPVKWSWTLKEDMQCWDTRHAYVMEHKTGVKKDGKIVAKKIGVLCDNGAYTLRGCVQMREHAMLGCGPYNIPNYYFDGYLVYTNKQPGGALRGFGIAQATWASDSQMDIMARELGMDPLEFRIKNCLHDGDLSQTGCKLQAVGIEKCLRKVAEMSGWKINI
jgi:CO/xanthine dehydrogenase Mo-binding subunit